MSGDHLRDFCERIERLHEEKKLIDGDIREVYAEVASSGYDKKALREVIKRRAKDHDERTEFETIVDLYEQEIANASRAGARPAREEAS